MYIKIEEAKIKEVNFNRLPRTGYGEKIPSHFIVRLPNEKRWRRVYIRCYSNTWTLYIKRKGYKEEYINDLDLF